MTPWVVGAIVVAVLLGVGWLVSRPAPLAPPSSVAAAAPARPTTSGTCLPHVELHPAAVWAAELDESEAWVLANHQVRLWEGPSPRKGRAVGALRVGSRAVILEEGPDDYRVRSPLDNSVGWISKVQVARTLTQDTDTYQPCAPGASDAEDH